MWLAEGTLAGRRPAYVGAEYTAGKALGVVTNDTRCL